MTLSPQGLRTSILMINGTWANISLKFCNSLRREWNVLYVRYRYPLVIEFRFLLVFWIQLEFLHPILYIYLHIYCYNTGILGMNFVVTLIDKCTKKKVCILRKFDIYKNNWSVCFNNINIITQFWEFIWLTINTQFSSS